MESSTNDKISGFSSLQASKQMTVISIHIGKVKRQHNDTAMLESPCEKTHQTTGSFSTFIIDADTC